MVVLLSFAVVVTVVVFVVVVVRVWFLLESYHNYKQHDVRKGRQPLHKRRTGNGISGLQSSANKVLVVVMY